MAAVYLVTAQIDGLTFAVLRVMAAVYWVTAQSDLLTVWCLEIDERSILGNNSE